MIDRNEVFTCEYCGTEVPKHPSSARNHCTQCLYSKHLDLDVPGDRKSNCHGLMEPIALDYDGKKGNMLIHKCTQCGKKMKNMLADDDNWDMVIQISNSR